MEFLYAIIYGGIVSCDAGNWFLFVCDLFITLNHVALLLLVAEAVAVAVVVGNGVGLNRIASSCTVSCWKNAIIIISLVKFCVQKHHIINFRSYTHTYTQ